MESKKKIAILTWFNHGRNYGQTLQAFALYYTLTKMGYNCELLSYGKRTPRLSEEEINELTGSTRDLQIHFTAFIKRYLNYSIRLTDKKQLEKYLLEHGFDIILCGSDQIWNPFMSSEYDTAYMLDFNVPCKKVAYATSMVDVKYISEYSKYPQIPRLLRNFHSISVRENSARTIVQELTEGIVDATVVLDPTMLLTSEEWKRVLEIPPINKGRYIFCYMFHFSEEQRVMLQQIARKNNCDTIVFSDILKSGCPDIAGVHIEMAKSVSIEMFLSLIQNATTVLTDSFHGAVFSIQFEKEFFCVESNPTTVEKLDKGHPRNLDRVITLLGKVGLVSRLILAGQEKQIELTVPIDYNGVIARLNVEQRKSLEWLQNAIEL